MTITILNTESELNSFPISQSIFLSSTEELEQTRFKDNIVLFRLQTENQLVNLAEPYSYTIGYLKETFDTVDLNFTYKVEGVNKYVIECKPSKLLNLDSTFCLFISKNLSNKQLTVTKNNSKSTSKIDVKLKGNFDLKSQFILKIEETSFISNNKNIVKVSFDNRLLTLDVRDSNNILSSNVAITLDDTIYVKGEEFVIDILPNTTIEEDLQKYLHTVNSKTINPIPKEEVSTSISNTDILQFYNTLNKKPEIIDKGLPKYIDYNVFSIKLPEGYVLDKTSDFKYSIGVAFNNYILKSLNLYDESKKYVCTIFLDDFENELIFELTYSLNENQEEKIIFNLDNME